MQVRSTQRGVSSSWPFLSFVVRLQSTTGLFVVACSVIFECKRVTRSVPVPKTGCCQRLVRDTCGARLTGLDPIAGTHPV